MNRSTEITTLLAELASRIQQNGLPSTSRNDEESLFPAISSFNQSLNFNDESRVRVLDTALSLMCFKAPQVFDSEIEFMAETIVSVLSSSISCKALRFEREEFLQIGSSISRYDCEELIEACLDVFRKLGEHGMLLDLLLHAVLRVAISSSCHPGLFPLPPVADVQPSFPRKSTAVSKLYSLLPEDISVSNHEIPSRLILWYLDPLSLRQDISRILWESAKRPFLCLKKELHEKMSWRSIIVCLGLSPTMFIETRTLLHNWFLVTGLTSILELQIEIVSSVLDVLTRPMGWGISMEVGSKLPFSQAYFPIRHHLLVALSGSVSCESFLGLVHLIGGLVSYAENHSDPIFKQTSNKARMIDHKSTWAMLMDFPVWFFFAAVLLFSGKKIQDIFMAKCTSGAFKTQAHDIGEHCEAAARYLAWILSPGNENHSDLLVDCLIKISRSWTLQQFDSDRHKDTIASKKKLRKPGFRNKDSITAKVYGSHAMGLWLKEFNETHVRYWNKAGNSSEFTGAVAPKVLSPRQSLLFTRIPLGILIGYPNVDEEACELLLRYAATGLILPSIETQNAEQKPLKQNSRGCEYLNTFSERSDERKETIAGASLVFNLFDVITELSDSAFETEESGFDFIYQLKVKTGRFLVKCVEKLIQITTNEDDEGMVMLMDLQKRLSQWMHQGREIEGYKALDDVVNALNYKISCYVNV